jgi:hypothetical protein
MRYGENGNNRENRVILSLNVYSQKNYGVPDISIQNSVINIYRSVITLLQLQLKIPTKRCNLRLYLPTTLSTTP